MIGSSLDTLLSEIGVNTSYCLSRSLNNSERTYICLLEVFLYSSLKDASWIGVWKGRYFGFNPYLIGVLAFISLDSYSSESLIKSSKLSFSSLISFFIFSMNLAESSNKTPSENGIDEITEH